MRCTEFREQHCAYVDDTLAGVELVRMQQHVLECPECAAHDALVRRALLLAHNLPPVEPSPHFRQRLEERLSVCRLSPESGACVNFKTVAAIGALASLLMVGYIAQTLDSAGKPTDVVLPPVVAMAEPPTTNLTALDSQDEPSAALTLSSAILASVSAGMPIWPAAVFAEQAPAHYTH